MGGYPGVGTINSYNPAYAVTMGYGVGISYGGGIGGLGGLGGGLGGCTDYYSICRVYRSYCILSSIAEACMATCGRCSGGLLGLG
jgi:hypothetical protein